ncbi:hypothetical protein BSN85_24850 [Bradyrhizobium brasilense]|uniref:DUF4238 domain-containing protein n=1 Tax=Bradyrhizobium brasilense TaxID=1419277 RepID=UPI00097589A8|nr:DUF4238 domain-containing protein [Bradyrhizobium brasilense]OMI05524.1 hypothetical protein BSN85_24850 [Bradyrhizobium brasilense]
MTQNQHYVPKFILRQFCANSDAERVAVYDKQSDKTFVTSIRNVMAENRFNDFLFDDDWIVSFEPIACAAEDRVLPTYKKLLESRRLDNSPQEKAALAFLIAFQFLRTKGNRDHWQQIEELIVAKVEQGGGRMQDVKGWEDWQPATENSLKRDHLLSIRKSIGEFAQIIGTKDFVLAEPAERRSFYLGDNPVCLHNMQKFGPYGNLGLAVTGIEIYMPLASDLLLCAWCPSILSTIRAEYETGARERQTKAVGQVMAGRMTAQEMKEMMERSEAMERPVASLLSAAAEGRPVSSNAAIMDYYNSMQTAFASRYIVCQQADFALARSFCREHPEAKRGRRMSAA